MIKIIYDNLKFQFHPDSTKFSQNFNGIPKFPSNFLLEFQSVQIFTGIPNFPLTIIEILFS